MPTPCPCQSGLVYSACCGLLHSHTRVADTAVALMRSRYSAYVLGLVDYIVATTVPAQQKALDVAAISDFSQHTSWCGLAIVHQQPQLGKHHARVEFEAFFEHENTRRCHHEVSTFVHIDERWYFVDPTVALSMKAPCVCGSAKRFKHCCGAWMRS